MKYTLRTIIVLMCFLCLADANAIQISGTVKDTNNNPIIAAVSDGDTVVVSDEQGNFSFTSDSLVKFVFVTPPSGYDIPLDATGSPLMYKPITAENFNFVLTCQADNGKADSTHVMLAVSDPQVYTYYDKWRFRTQSIPDMQALIQTYPENTKFYVCCVGDVVWDTYEDMLTQKGYFEKLKVPAFMTIGNHDHDTKYAKQADEQTQDYYAEHHFNDAWGPTYYSFNIGGTHYITLDNIFYKGYGNVSKDYYCKLTDREMDWLKQDLAIVAENTPVVVFMHAPLRDMVELQRNQLITLFNRNVATHIITGHSHVNQMYRHKTRVIEHNIGAVCGAFWSSDLCSDGSPVGYEVLQASEEGYKDYYYKPIGGSRSMQMRSYAPGSIDLGDGRVNDLRVNVWSADQNEEGSSKWKVYAYENGVRKSMVRYQGRDPKAYDMLLEEGDKRPNYPGSDGGTIASKNPGSSSTNHLFCYTPTDTTAELVVVVKDPFGNEYRDTVMRNMMVASFQRKDGEWVYEQDFNTLPAYPNHFSSDLAKGTFVPGHTPDGWYACTSGANAPSATSSTWGTFNYYSISEGTHTSAGVYNYGKGNATVRNENDAERAIGSLPNNKNQAVFLAVLIENTTRQTIQQLDITYTGEIWHMGSDATARQPLTFSYVVNPPCQALRNRTKWIGQLDGTNVEALTFTTPSTVSGSASSKVDGNADANRTTQSATLDVTLQPGETILLRWRNDYALGKEQGMAVDDLRVKAFCAPSGILSIDAPSEPVRKIYCDGQILIIKNGLMYDILGNSKPFNK